MYSEVRRALRANPCGVTKYLSLRRSRWATLIYRALTALLTLAAAGLSLRNLLVSSMLWDRSPLQVTLAALLLIVLAAGLSLRRSN